MSDAVKTKFTKIPSRSEYVWQAYSLYTLDCVLDVNFGTGEIYCSLPLIQSLRLTPETLPRTLEQWLELYHPDDYVKNLEFHSRVFEGTENAFSLERKLYCGDGVYRLFRVNAVCIRDKKKKIKRLIAVETEISVQERDAPETLDRLRTLEGELSVLKSENAHLAARLSQQALKKEKLEKRARLMTRMIDATPDLLFHRDSDGRLLVCNEAFSNALAYNPDLADWAAALAGEDERSYYDAYGRTRTLLAEAETVSLGGGDGYVGMARDMTEMEETRSDMERLKRLLGKYVLTRETEESQVPIYETDAEPGGANLNLVLETRLQKAFQAFSSAATLFPTRAAQLENLVQSAGGA